MDGSEDYLRLNRESWNNRLSHHLDSALYDLESFKAGRNSLDEVSLSCLGDIQGKRVLHLQCHFGQDTLSMARMGAKCTGIDLSDGAIAIARELNTELGLDAEFVECDVYSVPEKLEGDFDIVFSTYGTIGWLPDIQRWASIVAKYLKPGGNFHFAEFHPAIWMYDDALEKRNS